MTDNNDNVIETVAPIPFEELKKFFQDDNIKYVVDICKSELEGPKLLTYLGNLDIPVDITWDKNDEGNEKFFSLVKDYLHFDLMVSINALEEVTLAILYSLKGLDSCGLESFIEDNWDIIKKWERRIDQLLVYNMSTVDHSGYKEWIDELPVDNDDSREGINFVSLMKYPSLYGLLGEAKDEHTMNNPTFFNEPIFKGNNLFFYWAHEQNPLFLFQKAIVDGELSGEEYARIVAESDSSI